MQLNKKEALTIMAFNSILLGGTVRPPYWNVFFRFCSQALAIPRIFKANIKMVTSLMRTGTFTPVVKGGACFHPDIVSLRCEKPAAGISAGKAWELQSSGGRPWGCTAASTLAGSCHCRRRTHGHVQDHTITNQRGTSQVSVHDCSTYGLELVLAVSCFRSWQ